MTKHMTDEERMDYYYKRGREVKRKLEKIIFAEAELKN